MQTEQTVLIAQDLTDTVIVVDDVDDAIESTHFEVKINII